MSASFYDLLKYAKTGIASPEMTAYDKMRAVAMGGGGAIKTLTGVPPLGFTGNGKPLISWSMKGNGQQNGTPAPDNPIYPEFVGVKTGNLFDGTVSATNQRISTSGTGTYAAQGYSVSSYIAIEPSTTYSLSTGELCFYNIYDENKHYIYGAASYTAISGAYDNARYVRFDFKTANISSVMIVKGSTAPASYIPYGYRLPITCAGQTTPIYLGQTQTVRRIKKLVLTGTENWELQSINSYGIANFRTLNEVANIDGDRSALCSHFYQSTASISDITEPCFHISITSPTLYIRTQSTTASNATEFRTWLAQQYSSGTPVTIWYVLATPETAIVNEPLAKIGTYADELYSADAGVSIPTAKGANTLTVDTELQPSSMTITYRG